MLAVLVKHGYDRQTSTTASTESGSLYDFAVLTQRHVRNYDLK